MKLGVAIALSLMALAAPAYADVPGTISFTARLKDNGAAVEGPHGFKFALYDTDSGAKLWEQQQIILTVTGGLLSYELGSETAIGDDVFDHEKVALELIVDGVTMSPRLALNSVPYALRAGVAGRVPSKAAAPGPCNAGRAGAIYFNSQSKTFQGCDGSNYIDLGPRKLPQRFRAAPSSTVFLRNANDGDATMYCNQPSAPWFPIPGMSVTFTAQRQTEIEMSFTGSIADLNARTEGLHCTFRYLIDGSPVGPLPDPAWGHFIWSTNNYMWGVLGTELRSTVAAGSHTVTVEGRSGVCSPPAGYDTGLCVLPAGTSYGAALNVVVP